MHQVGKMDNYFPNVITGQMHHSEDTGGTAFHQAVIGSDCHDATVEFHSNPSVRYSYGLVVRTNNGLQVCNAGKLTTKHTDFCDNVTATTVSGGSHHNASGSRFLGNTLGADISHDSTLTALPTGGFSTADHEPTFDGNTLAVKVNNNSHAVFDEVTMNANTDDAEHDGVTINDLSAHAPETPGTKNSTFVFNAVN
jgi:hypothetical protein